VQNERRLDAARGMIFSEAGFSSLFHAAVSSKAGCKPHSIRRVSEK